VRTIDQRRGDALVDLCRRAVLAVQAGSSGPAVGNYSLSNPASLVAGATDYLTFAVSLPAAADNSFQGKSAALSLTFTGTQRTGTAR